LSGRDYGGSGRVKDWNDGKEERSEIGGRRSEARDKNETGKSDTGIWLLDAPPKPERGKAWRGVFCEGVRKEGRCE
jgi:hypothetical protein